MLKLNLGVVVALALLVGVPKAEASTASQGTTSLVHIMSSGIVLFYTSGSRSNVPSCATTQPMRFAFDSTTAAGRSLLAGLLAADAAKRPIVVVGTEACSAVSDSESVAYFYMVD